MLHVIGCAPVAPLVTKTSAVDIPAAWTPPTEAAALEASTASPGVWWLRFDDPLMARLVVQALHANTSVASAQAALRQARALRDVAAASLRPTLASTASVQRRSATSAALGDERSTGNSFQAGVDANWELDLFGANRSALAVTEATARASAASLGDVQVSIAAEAALAYITVRYTQVRRAIANENLASQQETLQITLWREQAGLVTALESEQARSAAEQTSALLPALETAIAQASHALAVLIGQPPASLSAVLVAGHELPQASDGLAWRIPAETLRQRADVRAAEQQVIASQARVSQAETQRWPNFTLGGTLGLSALTLGSLTNGASVVGSLLASVDWPVFDGGLARAQVDVQQAALEQARQAYRAAVLLALKEVEDALAALRGDRLRLTSLGQAAEAATSAARMASQRYSSGLVDFQTVLETQRMQLGTQDSVASARADVSSDHVRLYKALGGAWSSDHMEPVPNQTSRTNTP
ncbi:MAG: efflux transporter outer membrane subunit [Burkholderiales bacterium]|nr:efflux transporter outer membrane subunit [Burkholderiales bacterium]